MIGVRYLPVGECALSVEFGDKVDLVTNARVLALDKALAARLPEGVIELVPTYRALMIHFDPLTISGVALHESVEQLVNELIKIETDPPGGRLWRVIKSENSGLAGSEDFGCIWHSNGIPKINQPDNAANSTQFDTVRNVINS